jgi:hypothetical protein
MDGGRVRYQKCGQVCGQKTRRPGLDLVAAGFGRRTRPAATLSNGNIHVRKSRSPKERYLPRYALATLPNIRILGCGARRCPCSDGEQETGKKTICAWRVN